MQSMLRKGINFIITFIVVLFILICAAFALYALWDNKQIYEQAQNVQADMLKLKPKAEAEDSGPGFSELLDINPDVKAWLSMENTKIDFPILQGENNLSYINTDVYGNFALAGSIFMDSRNKPDFSDPYIVTYGHHMEGGNMFGDLDKYKDEKFFLDNPNGELILPDRSYKLKSFAVLVVTATDSVIFHPYAWTGDLSPHLQYIADSALYTREELLQQIMDNPQQQILALSTCSGEFTDARTVVLTLMCPDNSISKEG